MSQMLKQLYLTYGGDGKAIPFTLHANLLQGNLISRVDVDGLEDLTVRACTNH